jgi:hypothetical protein
MDTKIKKVEILPLIRYYMEALGLAEKPVAISASRPSASVHPWQSPAPRPCCLPPSPWLCLMVYHLREHWSSLPRSTAWYLKSQASFSDLLALVRRPL